VISRQVWGDGGREFRMVPGAVLVHGKLTISDSNRKE
jgi:hypothetical protein